jgi:Ca2+-binding EF-hand superfamily protein
MLTSYGVDSHNQSLSIAVTEGTSTNKPIDFTAFLQIFTANFYAPKSRESYRKVFRLFDD